MTNLSLPPKVPLSKFLSNPAESELDYLQQLAQFGDIVQIPGAFNRILVNDPDSIQRVLQTHFDNYTKERTGYQRLAIALGNGLLTNSGEAWEKRRGDLQGMLHLKNLTKFVAVINHYTQATLQSWQRYQQESMYFDLADELLALTAKISAVALFGIKIDDQVHRAINLVLIGNTYAAKSLTTLKWFPSLLNLRFRYAHHALNQFLLQQFAQPRDHEFAEPLLEKVITEYNNGVITKEEFLGDVKNFFIAGHETTGNALGWTWVCLLQNPDTLAKLKAEVNHVLGTRVPKFSDLDALQYTELVLEEALRLYPPIWAYERRVIHDDELGGYRIPANSLVTICPYTIQRHPRYWEQASSFIPERFLPENSRNRPKCAYIPFGVGPRVCIGKQFAMLIAKMVLASMVQRFELKLAQRTPVVPEPLVTLKPKGGIWVQIANDRQKTP